MTIYEIGDMLKVAVDRLESFRIAAPAHVGPEHVAKAKAQVEAAEQKLERLKSELAQAEADLEKAKATNLQRHNAEVEAKYTTKRACELAFDEASVKLAGVEQAIRDRQAQDRSLMMAIEGLENRLRV